MERLRSFSEIKSLGAFYGQITGLLGLQPDRHEGKITGLAAYGRATSLIEELFFPINFVDGDIVVGHDFVPFVKPSVETTLKKFCEKHSREDVAYAAQEVLDL